jgi:Ca2+-binding RTX toxin-like protein
VLAILIAGTLAPAAGAATVSIQQSEQTVYVSILGGPENDALTVSSPSPGRYTVTQAAGVPLVQAGNMCELVAPTRVDCVAAFVAGALLMGGDGHDRLEVSGPVGAGAWLFGGTGDDEIFGGPGADRLEGEAGADVLHATDVRRDTVTCGTESDRYDADDADTVAADCEQRLVAPPAPPAPGTPPPADPLVAPLPAPLPPAPAPVAITGGTVTMQQGAVGIRVSCAEAAGCRGWITVRMLPRRSGRATAAAARRPVISRKRYRVRAGGAKTVTAKISRRGRQRVLKRRRARCSVAVSTVAPDGTKTVTRKRITIKAGGSR